MVDGAKEGKPFPGAAELDARAAVDSVRQSWLTVKGLTVLMTRGECARRSEAENAARGAVLQHVVNLADAHTVAVFASLMTSASGRASQLRAAVGQDMARLRSCAGALASARLTACFTELTAVEFHTNALLCLGEDLCPGKDRDMACVCGRAMAAGGTHALVCSALWHTVVGVSSHHDGGYLAQGVGLAWYAVQPRGIREAALTVTP